MTNASTVLTVVAVLIAVAVLVALVLAGVFAGRRVARARRLQQLRVTPAGRRPDPQQRRPRAAIIVNPTKLDAPDQVRRTIAGVCEQHGWQEPLWLETTEDDPGTGQAREALAAGVDLVCPLGGDGTVRAVCEPLVGQDTPLGLLPGGTGNLLARNLGLPVDSVEHAFHVALTGRSRRVDVGEIGVQRPDSDEVTDHVFMVMAGIGFDATVVSEAPEALKAKVGAAAYVVSGMRNLYGPRFAVDLQLDGLPSFHRRVRSVIVGNCGKLQGGLELLPDAELDDGWLDALLLSPTGIVGWAAVLVRVVTKRRRGHERVDHHRCRRMVLVLSHPEEVQLDGDVIGPAIMLTASVRPGALLIRVR
ncbi:MAG TPA: diacylglycerol kinase family protein [Dermatophilaceae bacterium]|nr:diacylglycerol kinase family protein [Dermatophilaceae bacterium]